MTSAPMAFTFGLGITPMFPLRFGAASATIEQASPPALLEAVATFGVTHLGTAPTAYKAMLSQPALEEALKTLRYCISAGEHLPEATSRAWKDCTGIAITDGIGSTEMMHIFVSAAGDDVRPGSTGKAVPGYTATVLDADGNPLDEGVGDSPSRARPDAATSMTSGSVTMSRMAGTSPATPTAATPTAIIGTSPEATT